MLAWRLRIVVLWLSLAVGQSAGLLLLLLQPAVVDDLAAGRLRGEDVQGAAVQGSLLLTWLVPLVMAYLTLVLKDTDCRQVNTVLGGGSALYGVTTLVTSQQPTPVGLLMAAVGGVLVPLLILWHAWKWPRPGSLPDGEK